MREITKSIFIRIILFNIIFISLITYIFQVMLYYILDNQYIKQLEKLNTIKVQERFDYIENNILKKSIELRDNYFSNIGRNYGVIYPIRHHLYNNPSAILKLKNRLEDIYLNYDFIISLDIYYPINKIAVTNFFNIHYLQDEKEVKSYLPWIELYNKANKKDILLPVNKLNYPQNKKVITYATSIFIEDKKSIVIGVHIDTSLLDRYIENQIGHFLIVDRDGNIIYEKGKYDVQDIVNLIKNNIKQLNLEGKPLELIKDEQNLFLNYKFSNIIDVIYLQIDPQNTFYQEYNKFICIVKIVCILHFIINILGVLLMSRREYKMYGEEVTTIIQGSKERKITFDESIKIISDKIFSLDKEAKSNNEVLLKNEILDIIEGNYDTKIEDNIKEKIGYNKIYTCIIKNNINIYDIKRIIDDLVLSFKPLLVKIKNNEVWLLIAYNASDFDLTIKWIKEIEMDIFKHTSNIFISESYNTSRQNIISSFKEINKVRDYYYIHPEKKWLFYKDLNEQNTKETKNHLKIFSQIEGAIKSNDYKIVEVKIEQLIVAFQSGYYNSQYCYVTLRDLVTYINHLYECYKINSIEVLGYDIRKYFEKIENIYEFKVWILLICKKLIENIQNNKEYIGKQLEEKIISIIEDNLENDISLEFLANKINMRADVLSKFFKSIIGKNYSDYIKERKLEYALQLLMTQKYTVKEIGDRLGYTSTQYFIKLFKNHFGETPKQYQKNKMIKK